MLFIEMLFCCDRVVFRFIISFGELVLNVMMVSFIVRGFNFVCSVSDELFWISFLVLMKRRLSVSMM